MKKLMMIAVLVLSSVTFAQNREPKLEEVNGAVKATYYHENGVKIAIAEYSHGEKVGNWFFWNNEGLSEVDYSKDAILSIKKWSKGSVASN